jgi:hypothetical protein
MLCAWLIVAGGSNTAGENNVYDSEGWADPPCTGAMPQKIKMWHVLNQVRLEEE